MRTRPSPYPEEGARTATTEQGSSETLLAELGESAPFRAEFGSIFGAREYGTGVESAVFADSTGTESGSPCTDYDRLVRPSMVHALVEGAQWGPEDVLAGAFAHAYQRFLFHHYQLAAGVLGTGGTGSLGYGLGALARRAAAPLFPELDRARARVATVSDVQYDHISGVVFTHAADEGWEPADGAACPEPLMRETVGRMFRALSKRDPKAWCEGFATDLGRYRSSPGTRPYVGRGALGVYIDKVFRFCAVLVPRFAFRSVGTNRAEVAWTCDITTVDVTALTVEGKSELRFTSEGRITEATSLWNHEKVAAELLRTARPKASAPGTGTVLERGAHDLPTRL